MNVIVKNVPPYAEPYEWIVARPCDGELWFWGAYHDRIKAWRIAEEIGGVVVENGGV